MPNPKIQTHKYLYSLVLNQWPLSVLNSPNFDFPNKPTGDAVCGQAPAWFNKHWSMRGGGCWEERKTVINSLQRELCIQTARERERKWDAGRKAGSAGRQKKIKIQKTATASEMQLRNTRSAHNGFCTVDICRKEEDTEENNYMLKAGFVLNQLLSGNDTPRKLPYLLSRLHLGSAVLAVEAICLCWREAFKWHSTCCHQKDFAVSFLLHQASSREKKIVWSYHFVVDSWSRKWTFEAHV